VRFTLAAIAAGAAWWGIGLAMVPDFFLHRAAASLVMALLAAFLTASLSRPFYRGSAWHLLWLTPVSVYFAAAVFGYTLPLATERLDVLERCLETVRTLCVGATLTVSGLVVFPAALATHWALRRLERRDEPTTPAERAA
jgi:hypothetical protein